MLGLGLVGLVMSVNLRVNVCKPESDRKLMSSKPERSHITRFTFSGRGELGLVMSVGGSD